MTGVDAGFLSLLNSLSIRELLMNIKQKGLAALISAVLIMPANATEVTLVSHASVDALVSGFNDIFQQDMPYYDVYMALVPAVDSTDPCSGNHPGVENIWAFSDADSPEVFNADMVYSLINMAWITKSTVSFIGDAVSGAGQCSQQNVRYIEIHKDLI